VQRALSKDRFARFQNATEFRQEAEAAGAGAAPAARQAVPASDFNATLFGVNPTMTAGSDAALRQLSVDQEARTSRTQQRPPVAWIWAGILLLIVIIVAVVVWTITLPRDTGIDRGLSVHVPSYKGQSYDGAAAKLKKLGLHPHEQQVASNSVAPGAVISTTPAAGSLVGPHTSIAVTVSSGPQSLSVPNLVGLSATAAAAQLQEVGLKLGTSTTADSATVTAGLIISTSPTASSHAVEGDTINITVSSGKVNIPSVVGQSGSAAGSTLTALHLNYSTVGDSSCSSGNVTAQSLIGEQPQYSSMTITVCTGGP
jgi:serine/threonine-protein kinase